MGFTGISQPLIMNSPLAQVLMLGCQIPLTTFKVMVLYYYSFKHLQVWGGIALVNCTVKVNSSLLEHEINRLSLLPATQFTAKQIWLGPKNHQIK